MPIKHTLTASSGVTLTSANWNADHTITSADVITNLNADMVDGFHANQIGVLNAFDLDTLTVTTTSAIDTPLKTFFAFKDTANFGLPSSIIFEVESQVTSGQSFFIVPYINGSSVVNITNTATAYTLKNTFVSISSWTNLVMNTIEICGRVSPGGTGTLRVTGIFLKG